MLNIKNNMMVKAEYFHLITPTFLFPYYFDGYVYLFRKKN